MFDQLIGFLSFGRRYGTGAVVYVGLALLLLSSLPGGDSQVRANDGCDAEGGTCPTGYYCCHGACIPMDYICCDDGTNGPAATCSCCTGCDLDPCVVPSTVQCMPVP
jgi:hypothetical protein